MTSLYKVQRITGKRKTDNNQIEYKVKWVGYTDKQSTWQPLKNLKNVQSMVRDFEKRNAHKMAQGLKANAAKTNNKEKTSQSSKEDKPKTKKQVAKKQQQLKASRAKQAIPSQSEQEQILDGESVVSKKSQDRHSSRVTRRSEDRSQKEKSQKSDTAAQGNFQILDMKKDEKGNEKFFYFVQDEQGNKMIKPRQYIIEHHSDELIRFYESKIKFM